MYFYMHQRRCLLLSSFFFSLLSCLPSAKPLPYVETGSAIATIGEQPAASQVQAWQSSASDLPLSRRAPLTHCAQDEGPRYEGINRTDCLTAAYSIPMTDIQMTFLYNAPSKHPLAVPGPIIFGSCKISFYFFEVGYKKSVAITRREVRQRVLDIINTCMGPGDSSNIQATGGRDIYDNALEIEISNAKVSVS